MLSARSVSGFLESVASTDEPVPAGGSTAALVGAGAAALLVLACGVRQKRQADVLVEERARAEALRQRLIEWIDRDAQAYDGLLDAKRAHAGVEDAQVRSARAPLEIALACLDVVEVADAVEPATHGALLGDVRAARTLAGAAAGAALTLAEQDVVHLAQGGTDRIALEHAIAQARRHPALG